jgi:hypothetical protein
MSESETASIVPEILTEDADPSVNELESDERVMF